MIWDLKRCIKKIEIDYVELMLINIIQIHAIINLTLVHSHLIIFNTSKNFILFFPLPVFPHAALELTLIIITIVQTPYSCIHPRRPWWIMKKCTSERIRYVCCNLKDQHSKCFLYVIWYHEHILSVNKTLISIMIASDA